MESLLAARIGLDPGSLAPGAVSRAVKARSSACGVDGEEGYARRLAADPLEWDALVEAIVVPETWFFRDGGPFRALSRLAAEGGSPARPAGPLRVLSMPCATGEEAWSMAMVLASHGLGPEEARVDAVDLSRRALAAAERGVYGPASFRGTDSDAWRHAFQAVPGGLEVDPALRTLVTWSLGNALEWGGPAPAPAYDAIFCRNLLIYFGREARERLLARLDTLLHPGGLLVLGHAEPPRSFFPSWEPVDVPRSFAARKPLPGGPAAPTAAMVASTAPAMAAAAPASRPPAPLRVPPPRAASPAPPRPLPSPAPAEPGPLLERARRHADRGELEPARRLCEEALRLDAVSAEARFLLGLVAAARGASAEAESEFSRVLYLEPSHAPALSQLALLLEAQGRAEEASRLRRRASRSGAAP